MLCIVFSILAQLICRSSHGVVSNKVHVPDSTWPAITSHYDLLTYSQAMRHSRISAIGHRKRPERLPEGTVYRRTERFDVFVKVESRLCTLGNTLRCKLGFLQSNLEYELMKGVTI